MEIDELLRPRVLIVSGKGGVGKTTVAAALAVVAARHGRKVCITEVDRKGTLPSLFGGGSLSYDPAELAPGLWGVNILPEDALAEYLDVQYHMKRVSRVFTSTHFVDYITTAAPGLKDILVLGKIWYLEQNRGDQTFDTIVVDAPAAGHMLSFLSAPMGLSEALKVGPVRRQSDWLIAMLRDPARTRAHLVTLPEEMPVSETIETSQALASSVGIDAGPLFVNAIYDEVFGETESKLLTEVIEKDDNDLLEEEARLVGLDLDAQDLVSLTGYGRFVCARRAIQLKHVRHLRKRVDNPLVELPFIFSAGLELPDIETIADAIEERVAAL